MGVTIGTRRCGISMGYGSFFRFRVAVASSINSVVGWVYESYVKESIKSLYRNDTYCNCSARCESLRIKTLLRSLFS